VTRIQLRGPEAAQGPEEDQQRPHVPRHPHYSVDRKLRLVNAEPQSKLDYELCSYGTSTSQIAILHRISSIVSSELSLDEVLGEIVGLTSQVTGCDACLVYLIEREPGEIVLRASQVPHAADLAFLAIKMGEGVTGWVAEHKSVVALRPARR
jgi:hypothetical protein